MRNPCSDPPKLSYPCRSFAHVFEGGRLRGRADGEPARYAVVPGATELVPGRREWHPARLGELMPVGGRDDAGMAEEMRRANIADSRLWAYRVEMIVQLADPPPRRPRPPGRAAGCRVARRGPAPSWLPEGVSEFLPDEVALIMNCSRSEATRLTAAA